ncbi:hypothetical protein [Vibrio caribbeanicus]|uniref:hypothetical protein n=1 Tax=Vibrio caribbeanicus TaxID=701175 RepID=UPI002285060E|nr:hypothetical protein [Vibrio caribbeanicus]MCY9846441.1 hypothetical protein [Vibrio caribbeanicus]
MIKKTLLTLLCTSLPSGIVHSENMLTGFKVVDLDHQQIFDIYKEHKVVYDSHEQMHEAYDGMVTANYMTVSKLRARLDILRSDINHKYRKSGSYEQSSRHSLIEFIDVLQRITDKLTKLQTRITKKPNLLDENFATSVNTAVSTDRVKRKTLDMTGTQNIQSGYAKELNLIAGILNEICNGYKERLLLNIIERSYEPSQGSRPYTDQLHFEF